MPSSFTTRTFTRPSLVGTMAGRKEGERTPRTERRRIISVPGRNLARGGEVESRLPRRASGSVRGGTRGDPNGLPRVRVGVSARREETSARGAQCRPRGLFGYLSRIPEAERRRRGFVCPISRQKMIRGRPSVRSRLQISPGRFPGGIFLAAEWRGYPSPAARRALARNKYFDDRGEYRYSHGREKMCMDC